MKELTGTEKRILNRIQRDWRITETPFKELAHELKTSEDDLIKIIDDLKNENIIRDISGIFNAGSLGYKSALIAYKIPKENVEQAATIINTHPGVSHNYLRDHSFNIWFTLAVNPEASLKQEADALAEKTKAEDYLIFRNERTIKIGLMLDMEDTEGIQSNDILIQGKRSTGFKNLTEQEKKAVYVLQTDLLLVKEPFKEIIKRLNLDIDEKSVVHLGEGFKKEGIMRRYSAILKHNQAGYNFNAMTAWNVKNTDERTVQIFSSVRNISHLYFRTIYPGKWDHGLFAMIHAKSEDELNSIIYALEKESGTKDYLVLHSLREYKKKRIKYFTEEFSR